MCFIQSYLTAYTHKFNFSRYNTGTRNQCENVSGIDLIDVTLIIVLLKKFVTLDNTHPAHTVLLANVIVW